MLSRYTVSVDLREPPKNGEAQIVFRCEAVDRDLVRAAAALIGISVNRFMRAVVIQAAKQVIQENNEPSPKPRVKLHVSEELPPGMQDSTLPPGMKTK